jgi:hypothetical protein
MIEARDYTVNLSADGLIRSMTLNDGSAVITDTRDQSRGYLGGEIRAVTDGVWVDNLDFECSFWQGPVCSILQRTGRIAGVPLSERYLFFLHEPLVKVHLTFDFDADEIGNFHILETKLNVYYPTTGSEAPHDIPFGYSTCGDGEQVFAPGWIHSGGLTYVNKGTATHWIRDGVIANVIGWGGLEWTNRIHYDHWMKLCGDYDLRLYGRQEVEYCLIPSGEFDGPKVSRAVQAISSPTPIASGRTGDWAGGPEIAGAQLSVSGEISVTGIYQKDGQSRIRGYQLPGGHGPLKDWEIFDMSFQEAASKGVTT